MSSDIESRIKGERERLAHAIKRLRGIIEGLEISLRLPGPIGADAAQAIHTSALEITASIARHDIFSMLEPERKTKRSENG